ncbi:Ig-like domain-containing protein [Pseudomonas sp. NPDC098747]|uniref:Ig-like domain-containing protein n=1 Tax=Pseudomonas sp. NPDC098747 TaxID=3364487 RepID=UPI00383A45D5
MDEPVIQANESLVLNGDFTHLTGWKRGGLIGTATVNYEGNWVNLLEASDEGWVRQVFKIPVEPGINARYTLSFLCEVRHIKSGWLRILKGQDVLLAIELKPAGSNHLKHVESSVTSGETLAFIPFEYDQELLSVARGDELTLEIISPQNAPTDKQSKIRVTRVKVLLHLTQLKLKEIKLDEQTLLPNARLYLCLGTKEAECPHVLNFVTESDVWLDTAVSLKAHANPNGAVTAVPDWGVNQSIDSHWLLDIPRIDDLPSEFSIALSNRYSAFPYVIGVSLGHHRLAFTDEREAAIYPVLEQEQSVKLGLRVVSYYTHQPLAGQTITWSVEGLGSTHMAITDENGWCDYVYQPTTAGDFIVIASVVSPYYAIGVVTREFQVKVLEKDPWPDLRAVVDGELTAWEAQGYPNRGSAYPVQLRFAENNPLVNTELSLHLSGDLADQLGVDVSPALESPVPVTTDDLVWTLTSKDQLDGRFQLTLRCSKLLEPSPAKPMSLARNRVKIGEVREANKSPIVDEDESVLLRLQVLYDTSLGDGAPVINALVDWRTPEGKVIKGVTGADGWASVSYPPETAGELVVTASIKAHPDAVSINRDFTVHAIESSPWKKHVQILLDGETVDLKTVGLLCRHGQTHTLKVVPYPGSPWTNTYISLRWRGSDPHIGLSPSDLGQWKPLLETGAEWTLDSAADDSISSLFDLELRLNNEGVVRALPGRLLSADLNKEVQLMLDQVRAQLNEQSLHPCLGAIHRFKILPNALSPLVGLKTEVKWTGDSAEKLGATIEPALDVSQTLDDGGVVWTLDFSASEQRGQFELTLALPDLDFVSVAKTMDLHHNKVRIKTLHEAAVYPVVGQTPVWLSAKLESHFTGQPVGQVTVKWWNGADIVNVQTDDDGLSRFPFAPKTAGEHSVVALVFSDFDNYEDSGEILVKALASDPWDDLMVCFEDQPEQPWGEKTYFPRNKGSYAFRVSAKTDSELCNHQIALGMTGTGPAQLGIRFLEPALGKPASLSSAGINYLFIADGTNDGSFGLCFASELLADLSPVNAMSLGEGSQVIKIAERQSVHQTLFWGDEVFEAITVVSSVTSKPMAGKPVTWRSPDLGEVTTDSSFQGVAGTRFVPVTPGAFELIATVGDALYSESLSLSFFLNEPREIHSFTSPKPSGHLGERVYAVVNVVSALTGEPLQDVEVEWEYPDRILAPTRTDAHGDARVEFRLPGIRRAWLLASVKGGFAGWVVKSLEFQLVPTDV